MSRPPCWLSASTPPTSRSPAPSPRWRAAGRVQEAVWHRAQRLVELPDGGVELTFTVAGIVEIRPWILSWGDGVEVLSPASLRESVAASVARAAERYQAVATRAGG